MSQDKKDASHWPPPPEFSSDNDAETEGHEEPTRLLTGVAWTDALFGVFLSLISFMLPILILFFIPFNPHTASLLLPSPTEFLAAWVRLLIGWCFASVFQVVAWRFFQVRDYHVICPSIALTAVPTAMILLALIGIAWLFQ